MTTLITCVISIISLMVAACFIGFPLSWWPVGMAVVIAFVYFVSTVDYDDKPGGPSIIIGTLTCAVIVVVSQVYILKERDDEKLNIQVQCQDGIYWPK